MDARLQTFAGDAFDATAFVARPSGSMPKMGPHGRDRMLKDLAVIVSVLTPAQPELLATKLDKGPAGPVGDDDGK